VAFDPFLYVALAAGFLAGRVVRWRSPWLDRLTLATVATLLALLGASLGSLTVLQVEAAVPVAVGFAALLLGGTAAFAAVLGRKRTYAQEEKLPPAPCVPAVAYLAAALVAGYLILGRLPVDWGGPIEGVLYALLFLVGFDLRLSRAGLRTVATPLAAAVLAASGAAVAVAVLVPMPLPVAAATAFGFGWYSLAGPLVAAKVGPTLGLVAFLTNFLREVGTMLSAPWVGARLGGDGIAAMGGATSMDTTLYFAGRYGGREASTTALATGLALTLAAGLLLPALLGLPGA
jgi:uncharacterized membrane protein YbjE (DUF340 family)